MKWSRDIHGDDSEAATLNSRCLSPERAKKGGKLQLDTDTAAAVMTTMRVAGGSGPSSLQAGPRRAMRWELMGVSLGCWGCWWLRKERGNIAEIRLSLEHLARFEAEGQRQPPEEPETMHRTALQMH